MQVRQFGSWDIGYRSDIGQQRSLNEDSYLVLTSPHIVDGIDTLLVVADGMGGHQAGEVASDLVVKTLDRWFSTGEYRQLVAYSPEHDDYYVAVLKELLDRLNTQIYDLAVRQTQLSGMGTTATVALIKGARLFLGHVGDSRAYVLREGRLSQLSQDHTWVSEQVQSGRLRLEEAVDHPKRNVLTQALGYAPVIRPDRQQYTLQPGDVLLLCSDGLSGVVLEETLRQVMLGVVDAQAACDQLIALANQAGGPDNITVLIARNRVQPEAVAQRKPIKEVDGGRAVGPQNRLQASVSRSSDTLRIHRRRTRTGASDAKATHLFVRAILFIFGLALAFGAGWMSHSLPLVAHLGLEEASACVAVLTFLLGLIIGQVYNRKSEIERRKQ